MRTRYYDPAVGRFLTQDTYPVDYSNPLELNRYVYVANNPVNMVDLTGHFVQTAVSYHPSQQSQASLAVLGQTAALLLAAPLIGFIAYLLQAALPDYTPYYPEIEVLPKPPGEQGSPGGDQDPGGGMTYSMKCSNGSNGCGGCCQHHGY